MVTKLNFYHGFTKRMFFLALATGLFVSISIPVTFLALSLRDQTERAIIQSQHLAVQLNNLLRQNPDYLTNVREFSYSSTDGLCNIKLYDANLNLLRTIAVTPQDFLDAKGRSPIVVNNKLYGYIEITRDTGHYVYSTLLLFTISSLLGLLLGVGLYLLPIRIVRRAESDISAALDRLNRLSYYDSLTNLPNRVQLNDRLKQALHLAERNKAKVAVLFLDLDNFKNINDTLGHSTGDRLLQEVAQRLGHCIRECDTVARLGGDEFIILLAKVAEALDAAKVAQRVVEVMAQPFLLDGHELVVTTSVGISVYPTDGDNPDTLVKNADTAMYRAKEQGKNTYQFYTRTMNIKALERLNLENGLRKALKQDELLVYYQPIIDLYSGDIIGMEALVRWQHPGEGLISPEKFIPLAEETGLIVPIGKWVLRTACEQAKTWLEAGFPPMYISVNISARQFRDSGLVDSIVQILKETRLEPQYLQLEITESIAAYNEKRVSAKLQTLRKLGIRIAIDDFGTGYSSLGSLKKFPFQTLKIDKSFIHNITADTYDAAITTTIIAMANSLKLSVVAEGVENEEQLAFLMERGCSAMQGYLFCKPLPLEEIEAQLIRRGLQKRGLLEAAVAEQ